tara:strand:+ start:155 stop:526 length:372 start_codon:yes stop_codon:yes gene_type:complete
MTKYNHMLDIAFTVISEEEDGSDITPEQIHEAIAKRLVSLAEANEYDIGGAIGICDTYEIEENDNEVVFLYGWKQSCLDAKGMFPVSSVDEIDPSKHWVDKAKLSEDKEAYWLELVEQYGERE